MSLRSAVIPLLAILPLLLSVGAPGVVFAARGGLRTSMSAAAKVLWAVMLRAPSAGVVTMAALLAVADAAGIMGAIAGAVTTLSAVISFTRIAGCGTRLRHWKRR